MALVLLALLGSACDKPPAPAARAVSNVSTNVALEYHTLHGVVKELREDGKTIVIRHEEVPGYMPAMTMPFEVQDPGQLRGIKGGDHVVFQMASSDDDAWITEIHAVEPPVVITNQSVGGIAAELRKRHSGITIVRDVDPLSVGDALPEYHFTNELGRAVGTKEFLGSPFAFTFFFTRCPMPGFCPKLSANFLDAQNCLKTNSDAPAGWHLFSISFDTQVDTPAVLQVYARNYGYDPAHWSFLTGDLTEITALGDQVGEEFGHDETGGITHKLRTVVVDAKGRVKKIWTNNEWTGADLARVLIEASK